MATVAPLLRPLYWVRSSKRDYRGFPASVQDSFGFALFLAQTGQHPPSAKPLRGLGGGVVELIEDFDGDTYRAVYTVRYATRFRCCTPSRKNRSAAARHRKARPR